VKAEKQADHDGNMPLIPCQDASQPGTGWVETNRPSRQTAIIVDWAPRSGLLLRARQPCWDIGRGSAGNNNIKSKNKKGGGDATTTTQSCTFKSANASVRQRLLSAQVPLYRGDRLKSI